MNTRFLSGQHQQRATFRQQITLAVVAGVLLMAVLSALLSAWQGSRQARDTLVSQGLGLAATVAQQTRLALLTQSSENAREAIEHALAFPEVRHIQLLFPDGRSLLTEGQAGQALPSPPSRSASSPYLDAESTDAWVVVAPVFTQVREPSPFEPEAARPELIGHVRLTLGKGALQQLVSRLLLINIGMALACSALLIFLLRRLTVRLTGPLDELAAVMNQAGSAGPAQRARPAGTRELVRMAEAFNRMMDTLAQRETELQHKNEELARHAQTLEQRVDERTLSLSAANTELQQTLDTLREAQKQLVEADKLASLGRLVAGVAHELNTPLGNALIAATALDQEQRGLRLKFEASTLRKSELQAGLLHGSESAALVHRNVQRAAEIIRGFKQLAIDQTTDMRRPFLADEVLGELLSSLAPMFKGTPYRVEAQLAPDLLLDSYPGPLGQVLTNIAQNALLHGFDGRSSGVFHVDCHAWGDEHVQIVCSDDGVGMSEAVRLRVFEPFFTTKFGQGGSGLGMQIVHTLVKGLLGGRVSVDSEPGLGTRVILTLPRQAPQAQGESDHALT